MSDDTLHVYFDPSNAPISGQRDLFIITEEIKKHNKSISGDWFTTLSRISPKSSGILSYDTFWPHIVLPSRGNLLVYAKFYQLLNDSITEDHSKIVTHSLDRGYELVVEDLCDLHSIDSEHSSTSKDDLSINLLNLPVLFLFVDQIISILISPLLGNNRDGDHGPLIFPYPERYDSTIPVIEKIQNPSIVISPLMVAWRFLSAADDWPEDIPATSLWEYTDLKTIIVQLHTLLQLQYSLWKNDLELTKELGRTLENEHDLHLPKTIRYICHNTVDRDIRHILSFPLIENAVLSSNSSSVVVGGQNVRERHVLRVAEDKDIDTFYIPHSIAYRNEVVPPSTNTTHFVAGPADIQLLEERYPQERLPQLYSSGRPLLDTLHKRLSDEKQSVDDKKRIIVGTQPYPNWIRRSFVESTLGAIDRSSYVGEVLIKVHPGEETNYYAEILRNNDYSFELSFGEGPIQSHLTNRVCVITLNSNVGLESIFLGAYCLSFNEYEPFVSPSSYIDSGVVPYITKVNQLTVYIDQFNSGIEEKPIKQLKSALDLYSIGNSNEIIANRITKSSRI